MLAFVGTTVSKPEIMAQLQAHAEADEFVKGQYWLDGRGCGVACTIHGSDHAEYEPRFGIPQMLAHLEDCIFEGLPNEATKEWPLRFMGTVEPGRDLSLVGWKFLHWLITDESVNPGISHPLVRDAVRQCAEVLVPLTKGGRIDRSAASAARAAENAARIAAAIAENAAASAARIAARAAWIAARAAWIAASATRIAASAAASAAGAARIAAGSARIAARAAASAAGSAEAASSTAWVRMADKLIELIAEAPIAQEASDGF